MDLPQFEYDVKPVYQQTVEREFITEIRPGQLNDTLTTLGFDFTLSENEFMVMSETYLYVKAVVETYDKEGKADTLTNITPINYLLNTMFRQATIEINGIPITSASNTFAYKSLFEGMLAYGKDARNSHLSAALWIDDPGKRTAALANGKEFDMMGRLHFDLTHQPRPIPGGCNVSVKLDLNSSDFIFNSSDNGRTAALKLKEVILSVRRAIISPSALKRIHSDSRRFLRIPFTRSYVRPMPIRARALDEPLEDVCRGRMPKRIFFAMVTQKAFHGSYELDPFKFKDFGLNSFACYIDGVQYPTQAYKPKVEKGLCAKEYIGFIQTLNQNNTDSYACISYEDFKNTHFILAVTLEPDCFDVDGYSGISNPPKEGTLRIQLGFEKETTENLIGLVYLEFDTEIQVSADGEVRSESNIINTR